MFQTLGFFVMGQPLYSMEDFSDLINIMIDLEIFLYIGVHSLGAYC